MNRGKMMSSANMTILGLYSYGETLHKDLFNEMVLPAGINRDDVINNILEQGSAFEILYPDFEYLQKSIGFWSKRWLRTFTKWYEVLQIEYDPLYNYNRFETWEDSGTSRTVRDLDGTTSDHLTGETDTTDTVNTTGSDELQVVAYNSDVYHNKEKHLTAGTSSATGHSETETTGTGSNTEDETISGTTSGDHSGHMYGNVGVMSTQDMLNQELDVQRFNLIQQITDCFLQEFCLLVY